MNERPVSKVMTLVAAVGVLALTAAGCGTASDAAGTSSARIERLEVPAAATCGSGATSVDIPVSYRTTGATRHKLLVDGRDDGLATKADATVTVPVHCDPLPHTVVLVAYDEDGRRTSLQRILQTT